MTNRKRSETYRFNGSPYLSEKSIHSVGVTKLAVEIASLRRKLDDPRDKDDKRWTQRWLTRYEKELAKKQRALATKRTEKSKRSPKARRGAT